jgi:inorganic pyrophosphatase
MNNYWDYLDILVATNNTLIDRPCGTSHPRYPQMVYPLDYGYLKDTISGDGNRIDIWLGTSGNRYLSGVILTVDTFKRDAEIKLLLGCSEEEIQTALAFSNRGNMRAILVRREKEI